MRVRDCHQVTVGMGDGTSTSTAPSRVRTARSCSSITRSTIAYYRHTHVLDDSFFLHLLYGSSGSGTIFSPCFCADFLAEFRRMFELKTIDADEDNNAGKAEIRGRRRVKAKPKALTSTPAFKVEDARLGVIGEGATNEAGAIQTFNAMGARSRLHHDEGIIMEACTCR